MIVKIHIAPEGKIIAVCDSDLLGKKFETEKLQLDLTSSFYKGEEKTEDELREILKTSYMVNLVGKHAIEFAKKEKIIDPERIIIIKGVPHAQAVIIHN